MKKRMKLLAFSLVCLLLLGICGCAQPPKTEVLIPVSVRIQDWRFIGKEEMANHYAGGYDFQYNENHVLQQITVIGLNQQVTNELIVTADEEGRILSFQSRGENLAPILETYTWTTQGNLLTHTRTDGKGERVIHREYNTKSQILSTAMTTAAEENVIAYEYSEDGLLTAAQHYDGEKLMCRTEYSYREDGRLAKETLLDSKDEFNATATYEYTEDGFTRITVTKKALISHKTTILEDGSTVTQAITPYIGEVVTVYTYDKAGFLIEEFHGDGNKSNMRYEYTYTTIYVDENAASRIFPMCNTLPATGILDQMTF